MDLPTRFNPLDYLMILREPQRMTPLSSWLQHIPFAGALVQMCRPRTFVELGTHGGDSYCAICDAVVELKLDTRCTAIDTWQGDPHAGQYGPEVLADLKPYHDSRYAKFSTLMQSTFDDALSKFADGSIDLLHIDGLHTYEAVKHDYETWRPKVSERGVILFHDTAVREADFGVWKLWEEISSQFPSFAFEHGYGLGILAVGPDVPAELRAFLDEANARPQEVRRFFEQIGVTVELNRLMRQMIGGFQQVQRMLDERRRILREPGGPTNMDDALVHPVPFITRALQSLNVAIADDLRARGVNLPQR